MKNNIRITVTGAAQAARAIGLTETQLRGRVRHAVADTAEEGQQHMYRMLTNPSPSLPGRPPGVVTGNYRASWQAHTDRSTMEAALSTDSEIGPWLEYGTSRMAARPHAGPVAELVRRDLPKNVTEALR